MTDISRRQALLAGGAALGGAVLTLDPVDFALAAESASPVSRTISGRLAPGAADWLYLPVQVPRGIARIDVSYSYSRPAVPPGVPGNSCDIGVFDERGTALGGRGFRGWSGGSRTAFSIDAATATPGYLPGPIGAGTWNIVLGPYQVAPQGLDYQVTVTLTPGRDAAPYRPQYPPQRVPGRGAGWYRGDSHLHTLYSDGKREPAAVAAGARAAGLDFIVSTDHNSPSAHGVWGPLAGDDLLILTGEEVTTRNGHFLALGLTPGEWIDWRYRARDGVQADATRRIRRSGGIAVPAHPYCPYIGCAWKFGYDDADAVEVWNGPWTIDDEYAVNTWDSMLAESVHGGRRPLPAIGNSDAHSDPQVIGLPHTVVRAAELSRDALVAGISAGRSWIAESAAVELSVEVAAEGRTAGLGDTLVARPDAPITTTVAVAGVPGGLVRIITDQGQLLQSVLPASGSGRVTWTTTAAATAYVRVEVRRPLPDGSPGNGTAQGPLPQLGPMAALSNPVYVRAR